MSGRELEDERAFLLRSLEDLDAEHAAGDLSDEDHARLRDDYTARAAVVLKTLEGGPGPGAAHPGRPAPAPERSGARRSRPRRGRTVVVAAAVVVVGLVLVSAVGHVGPRLPGESVTGSVTLTPAEQTARTLTEAETLESRGDAAGAVEQYQAVLRQDPGQEQALAELGWLEYEAGAEAKDEKLLSVGEGQEEQAERLAPSDFAPHLYLGSMFLAQGQAMKAVDQYRQFLAHHPPRAKVAAAASFIVEAFTAAHQTPPALPVGRSTATTG